MNRPNDDTSRALIDAAHRLLTESGPEALTVRRIANAAGMSTMNVYSRFGGKDGVIDVLYRDGFRRMFEQVLTVPRSDDAAAHLVDLMSAYRNWALANPAYYGIMFEHLVLGFEPSADSVAFAWEKMGEFVARVEQAQDAGMIARFDDWDAAGVATWLWANCHGAIGLELDGTGGDGVDWAAVFDHGIRIAVAGLHPSVALSRR